ncbi:kelch-like protein 6, partial [Saccoglossus kowalevskii]|uniref:Kelch-like protein 6-like n=1 Tax=Saccoglossus kowalevskii TaxID=10224 RepID=A0ABM0GKG6_SACKO
MTSTQEDQVLKKTKYWEKPLNIMHSTQIHNPDQSVLLLEKINVARKESKQTDVILDVDGTEFPCHKVVLENSCSYFKSMFDSGMQECHQRKITIKGVDSTTMASLLDYFFTGKIFITSANVQAILQAANLFQVLYVRDRCARFILNNLEAETCLGIWQMMVSLSLAGSEQAKMYALNHFKLVCKVQEFLDLSKELLIEIISDEELVADSETEIGLAVLEWFLYKNGSRKEDFVEVIQHVKLELITSVYLVERLCKELMLSGSQVGELEDRLISSQGGPEKEAQHRKNSVVCFIGGFVNGQPSDTINYFNPKNRTWSCLTKANTTYRGVSLSYEGGAVIYGNSIYTKVSDALALFNMDTNSWTNRASGLIDGEKWLKMELIDDRIFFLGGRFHCYDLNKKCEALVAPILKK